MVLCWIIFEAQTDQIFLFLGPNAFNSSTALSSIPDILTQTI